jgi:carbonic anhydrase/acetyltransferase-like protein (isoleucine patch superfamily)
VYITDQNHGYADPDTPIGRQMPVNTPVVIGPGTWLGTGTIVLPGARIGRNVVVAAGSVVRGEVPDYCVVAGVPAKVVRSMTEAGWGRPGSVAGSDGVAVTVDGAIDGAAEPGKSANGGPKAHI